MGLFNSLSNKEKASELFKSAKIKNAKGDRFGTIEDLTEIINLFPKDHEMYFHRGNEYYAINEFEKSISDFEMSLKYDPKNVQTLIRLGASKRQNGDMKGAYIVYSIAIKIDPKNSDLWFNRGHIKRYALDVIGATEDFKKSVLLGDISAQQYVNICSNFESGRPYEEFIDEMPLNYSELINEGLKYISQKKPEIALGFFMRAKELYPLLKGSDHFIEMAEDEFDF